MSVLRLFRFRPVGGGFDVVLRSVLVPDLLRLPGVQGVFAGRIGPDDDGPRLVASLWASREAMRDAVGEDLSPAVFHPELLDASTDRAIDAMPLALAFPPSCPAEVGILRLVRGRVRAGALDEYVREACAGTTADRSLGTGPQALYLATDGVDRFATLSLWDAWEHVEAATGADASAVGRTRHDELLETWTAEHYEVVPGVAVTVLEHPEAQPA